jgi:hypothetical protein
MIAHGMMLDPPFVDVRAADFRPGGRLVNAPGPGAPTSNVQNGGRWQRAW